VLLGALVWDATTSESGRSSVPSLPSSMRHLPSATCGGFDGTPRDDDPLAPLVVILDQAHRELGARELAALLLEVNRLAAVFGALRGPPVRLDELLARPNLMPLTSAGRAYRRRAAWQLRASVNSARHPTQLDDLGVRLQAYTEEVASRPAACTIWG
jgi:hypothetical protein